MYKKGSGEKFAFLCCIQWRRLRYTKGPRKRIRSPRRRHRRRSYTQYDVRERAICHCIGGGEVLSCPKRYRSVESRHVFCTGLRKYSRRDCVLDVWLQCEKKEKIKKRKGLTHTKRAYTYTYARTRTLVQFTPVSTFNWSLSRGAFAARPVRILIYFCRGVHTKRNRDVSTFFTHRARRTCDVTMQCARTLNPFITCNMYTITYGLWRFCEIQRRRVIICHVHTCIT